MNLGPECSSRLGSTWTRGEPARQLCSPLSRRYIRSAATRRARLGSVSAGPKGSWNLVPRRGRRATGLPARSTAIRGKRDPHRPPRAPLQTQRDRAVARSCCADIIRSLPCHASPMAALTGRRRGGRSPNRRRSLSRPVMHDQRDAALTPLAQLRHGEPLPKDAEAMNEPFAAFPCGSPATAAARTACSTRRAPGGGAWCCTRNWSHCDQFLWSARLKSVCVFTAG
jgi:hypothetical protein